MEMVKAIIVGISIVLALLVVAEIVDQEVAKSKYEIWQTAVFPNHRDSKCVNGAGIGFEIGVELKKRDGTEDYLGRYYPDTKTIEILDPTLDTIAHEAYHATQDIIREYDLEDVDEEYGAYLQGSLTHCIADIITVKLQTENGN